MSRVDKTFKIDFNVGNNKYTLFPYNTKMEKDILLMHSFEIFDLDSALNVLGLEENEYLNLSDDEKKAILLKLRCISIGDTSEIKFNCQHCNTPQQGTIELDNVVESKEFPKDMLEKLNIKSVSELSDSILDDLDLDDYEIVDNYISVYGNNGVKFNFKKKAICLSCRKENIFDIGDTEYILKTLSEDTLISLYQNYNDMIFFGKYTKQDVDTMYPFERTIFIGLINKTREDLNKLKS